MKKQICLQVLCVVLVMGLASCSWVRTLENNEQLTSGLQENTKKVWLVYSGSANTQVVEDVAEVFRGIVQVATLSSSSAKESLEIVSDNRENFIKYDGEFQVEKIVKFVLSNLDEVISARSEVARALKANQEFQQKEAERAKKEWDDEQNLRKKSDVIVLTASNWNSFVNGREAWVINFYEANCSACIQLNKDWELIATGLKGKVKVAKLNITEPGNQVLQDQIQLSKYPSVRFYKSGPKKVQEFSEFEGVHRRFSIQEWLNSKLQEKTTTTDIASLTKESYDTLCKSTKNTCIVVFLDGEDSSVISKIEELSVKHLKKPITFVVSKKGEQTAFAEQLGVSSYPSAVMVYVKQKKLWNMGGLDFKAIDEAIEEISMGNRNNFVRYTFTEPNLQ